MGRPSKKTAVILEAIFTALRAGSTRTDAAERVGIHRDTFASWMRDPAFAAAIKRAEAEAVMRAVARITKAADEGSWRAAAWWLERRYPQDFGLRRRRRTDPDSGPAG